MATQVGTAVVKLTFDGKDISASLNKVSSQAESAARSGGGKWSSAWMVAAGNIISKGVSKIAGTISNNLGGAINRVDAINNFPRVMQSLGYSAEESSGSIEQISGALDGLPTSLDQAVGDVQKLAATMGNLDQGMVNATSVGLGLNDMFLAGGKGTEAASAAMEQYNQMLARGKVDMQSWNSLVNAAPGQMNQLAESLLGAGKNQQDLYQAMQDGTVTFDQLNEAIVKLDQEGGAGFESFKNQAVAATDGIATQMQNIGTSLTKVFAAAISGQDINKPMEQLFSRISTFITTMGPGLLNSIQAMLDMIFIQLPQLIIDLAPKIMPLISNLIQNIALKIPTYMQYIINGILALVNAIIPQLPAILMAIVQAAVGVILTLTSPENMSRVLDAALSLLMAIVQALPQMIIALVNALPQVIMNIVQFLTNPSNIGKIIQGAIQLFFGIVRAVPEILGALLGAFGNLVGNLWNWITQRFGEFAGNFGNFIGGIFRRAINGVLGFIEGFINGPIDLINGAIDLINNIPGVDIGHVPRIYLPRLAQGGVATSATAAIFGEAGTEAVLPLERNQDNWAGLLASTLAEEMNEQGVSGAGITVYMTNEINNDMDADDIGRKLMTSIRRAA